MFLQPRALSVRPDCEISVEAQPATGLVIFWMFTPQLFSVYHTLPLQYQLTLVSNSFSAPADLIVLLIVWIRKGKFGELSFTMWWVCPTWNKHLASCNDMHCKCTFTSSHFLLFQQSSICRAAIHFGVLDNNGGLVDITRTDKFPFFVKATKNGIDSLR